MAQRNAHPKPHARVIVRFKRTVVIDPLTQATARLERSLHGDVMAIQERTSNDKKDRAASADRSSEGTASGANNSARGEPGITEVRTSDPDIVSPEPAVRPDRAVSYRTSQLSSPPAAYPFGTGAGVEPGAESANGKKHADRPQHQHGKKHEHKKHDGHHSDADDHRPRRKKHEKHPVASSLPGWPALLITGVLALACGVGGAGPIPLSLGDLRPSSRAKGAAKKGPSRAVRNPADRTRINRQIPATLRNK